MGSLSLVAVASAVCVVAAMLALAESTGAGARPPLSEQAAREQLQQIAAECPTLDAWKARAARVRAGILATAHLPRKDARGPLKPIVHSLRTHDGYTVENVALETLPGFWAVGNLYRPRGRTGPRPIVLCPHGHGRDGRFSEPQQKLAATLARMGAVAFSISMVGYNDSDQADHRRPMNLTLQLWNNIRALDHLCALEGVAPKRIGVTGSSGGGTQTFLLAAADERVAAAVPVVMVSAHFPGGCVCESGPPIHEGPGYVTNNAEIAALAAPRPILLISCGKDWTKNTPEVEFPFIRGIYRLYGAEDRVENLHLADEGHDYGPSKRLGAYQFLAKHLGLDLAAVRNADGTVDETKSAVEPAEALRVFDAAHPRPAHALMGAEAVAAALQAARAAKAE